MINNPKKEAKRILSSSLYSPAEHGNSFRQDVADEIAEKHISEINIKEDSSKNKVIVKATVKDIKAKDNRCMDFYCSKIKDNEQLYHQTENTEDINFTVIQKYPNDGDEIKTTYEYNINYT